MDGEGIWNACTINVITNTAITTVPSSDCNEPLTPVPTACGIFRSLEKWPSGECSSAKCTSGEFIHSTDPFPQLILGGTRPWARRAQADCGREARYESNCRAASCSAVFFVEPCARPTNSARPSPFFPFSRTSTVNVFLCSGPASSTSTYVGCGNPNPC